MLEENRTDSLNWTKLTLPDLNVSSMSEVLFTAQRDSQLNAVSKVHDILPTLTLKVVLYNVRARTGEHETSQENISVRSSFLFVFSLKEKKKGARKYHLLLCTKMCSLESGLQK